MNYYDAYTHSVGIQTNYVKRILKLTIAKSHIDLLTLTELELHICKFKPQS